MEVLASISTNSTYWGECLIKLTPEEEVAYQLWLISQGRPIEELTE
jgi:hypothetical protein